MKRGVYIVCHRIITILIVLNYLFNSYQYYTSENQNNTRLDQRNSEEDSLAENTSSSKNRYSENGEFIPMDLLLSANWTNVGDTILIINKSMVSEDGHNIELWRVIWDEISSMEFVFGDDEVRKKADNFINEINDLYSQGIKAVKYKKTKEMLVIVYENGKELTWTNDYEELAAD
jgi:hypothetical protein